MSASAGDVRNAAVEFLTIATKILNLTYVAIEKELQKKPTAAKSSKRVIESKPSSTRTFEDDEVPF